MPSPVYPEAWSHIGSFALAFRNFRLSIMPAMEDRYVGYSYETGVVGDRLID